jgi:hypothetical protein
MIFDGDSIAPDKLHQQAPRAQLQAGSDCVQQQQQAQLQPVQL